MLKYTCVLENGVGIFDVRRFTKQVGAPSLIENPLPMKKCRIQPIQDVPYQALSPSFDLRYLLISLLLLCLPTLAAHADIGNCDQTLAGTLTLSAVQTHLNENRDRNADGFSTLCFQSGTVVQNFGFRQGLVIPADNVRLIGLGQGARFEVDASLQNIGVITITERSGIGIENLTIDCAEYSCRAIASNDSDLNYIRKIRAHIFGLPFPSGPYASFGLLMSGGSLDSLEDISIFQVGGVGASAFFFNATVNQVKNIALRPPPAPLGSLGTGSGMLFYNSSVGSLDSVYVSLSDGGNVGVQAFGTYVQSMKKVSSTGGGTGLQIDAGTIEEILDFKVHLAGPYSHGIEMFSGQVGTLERVIINTTGYGVVVWSGSIDELKEARIVSPRTGIFLEGTYGSFIGGISDLSVLTVARSSMDFSGALWLLGNSFIGSMDTFDFRYYPPQGDRYSASVNFSANINLPDPRIEVMSNGEVCAPRDQWFNPWWELRRYVGITTNVRQTLCAPEVPSRMP